MKRPITGKMFVRKVGDKAILVAVIDLPKGSDIQTEALHNFRGQETQAGDFIIMTTCEIEDVTEIARGETIDSLLQKPIWRT